MKAIQLQAFGKGADGVRLVDAPEVPAPAAGEVVIAVEAAPITGSDLSVIAGIYGVCPSFRRSAGSKGSAGRGGRP